MPSKLAQPDSTIINPTDTPALSVEVVGIELHPLGSHHSMAEIRRMVDVGAPASIVTANVDHLISLTENNEFRAAYEASELRLVDGGPVAVLARKLGCEQADRTTGADLFPAVLEMAETMSWRVAVVGGSEFTQARVAKRVREELPELTEPLLVCPEFGFEKDPIASREVVATLESFRPHVVLFCVGAPKSELWWYRHARQIPAVFLHCGAAVDFYAGSQRRAPVWLQRVHGEWLYRLLREPRRLAHRYLVRGPRFFALARREIMVAKATHLREESAHPDTQRRSA